MVPVVLDSGPLYRSDGYTRRLACPDVAEWLVWYERLQLARGRLVRNLDVYQLWGDSSKSGGTHTCGSAVDCLDLGEGGIDDAREMGGRGWRRVTSLGWLGGDHDHIVIPCGCNGCNAYQLTACEAGYNGLGYLGRAGRDPHKQPSRWRTWQQGIAWARAEITRLQEDDMPTLDEVRAVIRAELAPIREDAARTIAAVNDTRTLALVKAEGDPAVWLTDGLTAVHVPDTTTLQDLATLAAEGRLSISLEGGYGVEEVAGVPVRTVRPSTLAALGAVTAEEL